MLPRRPALPAGPLAATLAAATALALAGTAAPARAATPSGPCADPALRCPDLTMRPPSDLQQRRGPSGKLLLAATNAIVNVGDGPAELRTTRIGSTRTMRARQVIRGRAGAPARVLPTPARIDFFDTGTRGVLWKWRHAIRFDLRRQAADGSPGAVVSRSPKIYSCLRDLDHLAPGRAGSPHRAHFGACSTDPGARRLTLGTSVGWADVYPATYPQNAVAIGGLRGCFVYEHVVDPLDQVAETDEDDNVGRTVVRLPWRGPGRRGCPALAA